ncbi:MAG: hypothetical protein V1881_01220 [Candidatus Micrarchaeota archaeon]
MERPKTVFCLARAESIHSKKGLRELLDQKLILPVTPEILQNWLETETRWRAKNEPKGAARTIRALKRILGDGTGDYFLIPMRKPNTEAQKEEWAPDAQSYGWHKYYYEHGRDVFFETKSGKHAVFKGVGTGGESEVFRNDDAERTAEHAFRGGARRGTIDSARSMAELLLLEYQKAKKEGDPVVFAAEKQGVTEAPFLNPVATFVPILTPESTLPGSPVVRKSVRARKKAGLTKEQIEEHVVFAYTIDDNRRIGFTEMGHGFVADPLFQVRLALARHLMNRIGGTFSSEAGSALSSHNVTVKGQVLDLDTANERWRSNQLYQDYDVAKSTLLKTRRENGTKEYYELVRMGANYLRDKHPERVKAAKTDVEAATTPEERLRAIERHGIYNDIETLKAIRSKYHDVSCLAAVGLLGTICPDDYGL